jgi:hypothetical protein
VNKRDRWLWVAEFCENANICHHLPHLGGSSASENVSPRTSVPHGMARNRGTCMESAGSAIRQDSKRARDASCGRLGHHADHGSVWLFPPNPRTASRQPCAPAAAPHPVADSASLVPNTKAWLVFWLTELGKSMTIEGYEMPGKAPLEAATACIWLWDSGEANARYWHRIERIRAGVPLEQVIAERASEPACARGRRTFAAGGAP